MQSIRVCCTAIGQKKQRGERERSSKASLRADRVQQKTPFAGMRKVKKVVTAKKHDSLTSRSFMKL